MKKIYDLTKYEQKYKDKEVINKSINGLDRPSHEAYLLWNDYKFFNINDKLYLFEKINTKEYYSESFLSSSSSFKKIFLTTNGKPYYIHNLIIEILEINNIKKGIKLAQFIRQYFGMNHPYLKGIFVFDKYANSRKNPDEEYVRADFINPGLQKNGDFWTLRFQGSRLGSNNYSKQSGEQNRKIKEMFLRFAQHGNDKIPLVCSKTGKECERILEICPLTSNQYLPVGYDLHHPKYTQYGSDNKNGKEPSSILSKASWNINEKIEMLGCLILGCGTHIEHHRLYRGDQDLTWWDAYWKSGKGYKPYILKSEENYKKVLNYFELFENEEFNYNEFSYNKFIKTLYFK